MWCDANIRGDDNVIMPNQHNNDTSTWWWSWESDVIQFVNCVDKQ
jgi:hypothetical protein